MHSRFTDLQKTDIIAQYLFWQIRFIAYWKRCLEKLINTGKKKIVGIECFTIPTIFHVR